MGIFERVLHVSAIGGIGILIFYIFWRAFGKKCHARVGKVGWILIAFYFILPFPMPKFRNAHTVEIPDAVLRKADGAGMEDALLAGLPGDFEKMPVLEKSRQKVMVGDLAFHLWAGVVGILGIYHLAGYWIMRYAYIRKSRECREESVIRRMAGLAKDISLRKLPCLRVMEGGRRGPFTVGLVKKWIFLPEEVLEDENLEFILRHEMAHCKENDNFWKLFFLAVQVVHWFNPMVWLMRKSVNQDMELVCDENVVQNASLAERKKYGSMLLGCLEKHAAGSRENAFSAGGRFMKRRFENIFNCSARRSGKGLVVIFAVILLLMDSMTDIEMKGAPLLADIPIEDFWNRVEEEEENVWRFATGLEITFLEGWGGKIVPETDCWPSPVPASNLLVVCEKTNAEEGVGGDLFYLRFDLYEDEDMVIMAGTVLGLYEQNDHKYVLTLSLPGSCPYVEGNEGYKAAYEELSTQLCDVRINTDWMDGFMQCGMEDLVWLHDDSWLNTH